MFRAETDACQYLILLTQSIFVVVISLVSLHLPIPYFVEKVICVPGVFFDINPRNTRNIKRSKCLSYVRFSYGPGMENLEKGVKHMRTMIDYWKSHKETSELYAEKSFDD